MTIHPSPAVRRRRWVDVSRDDVEVNDMRLGRIVAVGGMACGLIAGSVAPALAAPASPAVPGSAAQCKGGGGAVVEPENLDKAQESLGVDDSMDIGQCVGGSADGTPVLDPAPTA